MTYVWIDETQTAYPTDTVAQCESAQLVMRALGLESLPVFAGEPDGNGDSHKNGCVLFARDWEAKP